MEERKRPFLGWFEQGSSSNAIKIVVAPFRSVPLFDHAAYRSDAGICFRGGLASTFLNKAVSLPRMVFETLEEIGHCTNLFSTPVFHPRRSADAMPEVQR